MMQVDVANQAQDAGASTTTGPEDSPGQHLMEPAAGTPPPTAYGDNDALRQQKPGPRRGAPVCQVPGCNKDLSGYKGYHQRYKICEEHFRMPSMVLHGQVVRFCQQCGKFQPIDEFTNDRRSCSVQLALHAGRRRRRHALARAKKLEALKHRISGGSGSEDSDFDDEEEEDGRYSASARSGRKSNVGAGSGGNSANGLTGLTQQEVRMLRALIKSQKEGGEVDTRKQGSLELPPGTGVGMAPNSMFQLHTAGSSTALPALRSSLQGGGLLGPQDVLLPDGSLPGAPLSMPGQAMTPGGNFATAPIMVSALPAAAAGLQPNSQQQLVMMDWAGMGMPDQGGTSMAAQLGPMLPGSGTIMHGNGQTIAPGSGDSLQTRIQGLQGIMAGVPVQNTGSQPAMMLHGGPATAPGAQPTQLVWSDGKLQFVQQNTSAVGNAAPRLSVSGMTETGGAAAAKPGGAQAMDAAPSGPKSDSSTVGDKAPAASAPAGAVSDKNEGQGPSSALTPRPSSGPVHGGTTTSAAPAGQVLAAQAALQQQVTASAGAAAAPNNASLLQAAQPQLASGPGVNLSSMFAGQGTNRMAAQVAMQMQAHMQDLTGAVQPGNPFGFAAFGGGGNGAGAILSPGSGGSLQAVRQLGRVVEVLPTGTTFAGMPAQPVSAPVLRNLSNGIQILQWPPGTGPSPPASAEHARQLQQLSLISGQTTPQLASLPELSAYRPASTGQLALLSTPGMHSSQPQPNSVPNLQAFVQQQQHAHVNLPGSAGASNGLAPAPVLGSNASASCSHAPGDMAVDVPAQEGTPGPLSVTPSSANAAAFGLARAQQQGAFMGAGMPQMLNIQNMQLVQLPMEGMAGAGQHMQLTLPGSAGNAGGNVMQLVTGPGGLPQQWNLGGQQHMQQQQQPQQLGGMLMRQPVSLAGMQSNAQMSGGLQVISADDLQKLLSQGVQITELRTL